MLSVHEINRFLSLHPPHLFDIIMELRNLVAQAAPGATEVILWKGLSFYDANRGGPVSAGICQIEIHRDHVRLGFVHGAFLPDPHRLLTGTRKAKRTVRLEVYDDVPWEDLKDLIAASARFDPRALPENQS